MILYSTVRDGIQKEREQESVRDRAQVSKHSTGKTGWKFLKH